MQLAAINNIGTKSFYIVTLKRHFLGIDFSLINYTNLSVTFSIKWKIENWLISSIIMKVLINGGTEWEFW